MEPLTSTRKRGRGRRFGPLALISGIVAAMTGPGLGIAASVPAMSADDAPAAETIDAGTPGPFDFGYLTGTDDLGRELSHSGEVRAPREDRYVGLFYFLWLGQHTRTGPYNITDILADTPEAVHDPEHPAWGPRGAFHHWGEPMFDYYFSDDAWVLRKHAQMLANAEVDFLVFDATNAFTYKAVYDPLLEIFDDVRRQGWDVPQVVFYTNARSGQVIEQIYADLYKPGRHRDLWFELDGKPMIIGEPDEVSDEVREFFTFRRNQWPTQPKKPLGFPWMSFTRPQEVFYVDGEPDVVNVGVGIHNNLPFSDQPFYGYGNNWSRSFHDGALDPGPDAYKHGYNFTEQWEHALEVDPRMVMVTGWNEWVAQRNAGPPERPIFFVDQATVEFSRDAEPMKGGYNDNYYLQLVDYIRQYKGLGTQAAPSEPRTIDLDGDIAQWDDVRPAYRDFVGDTVDRNHPGFGGATYTDDTGRNDFEEVKVARDDRNVYFYARTADPIVGADADRNWMTLFVNTDGDGTNGWKGFDLAVNRIGADDGRTWLERTKSGWAWKKLEKVDVRVSGNEIQMAVPRRYLQSPSDGGPLRLEFKWADNMQNDGDVMDFYLHGDAAPDGRFSFLYTEDPQLLP